MESEARPSILLGVTGCIAAYKSCEILRGLQKADMDVTVIMTETATKFVGPATFNALTHHPVLTDLFEDPDDPIPHISHAEDCDMFLVAPCTANVMAKIAHGIADDLVTSTALAVTAPLVLAPAMNMHMYENPATQANIAQLRSRGVIVLDAASGYQACGDVGPGRLPEPAAIVEVVKEVLLRSQGAQVDAEGKLDSEGKVECTGETSIRSSVGTDASHDLRSMESPEVHHGHAKAFSKGDLTGKRVLITAGPTQEPIDPVRFISNYSSGKMGFALAQAAQDRGAQVTLVSGPVSLKPPAGVDIRDVTTAREMLDAAVSAFSQADIAICAAAVADYRPAEEADHKLKKGDEDTALETLHLVRNPDILATLAAGKASDQVVIGFAAETNDVVANAREKLIAKGADLIVANEVGGGKGFGADDDKATLVMEDAVIDLPLMGKGVLAERILDQAMAFLATPRG